MNLQPILYHINLMKWKLFFFNFVDKKHEIIVIIKYITNFS